MEMPGCMCLHYVQMLRPGIFFLSVLGILRECPLCCARHCEPS